ncbi:MAG: hypothetical protein V7K97_09510 [Nostoc sp.]|uniref:hypothetical protein n=1 Tax=Nostoc sp. TaxID=1180 RepID=UPI002FF7AC40
MSNEKDSNSPVDAIRARVAQVPKPTMTVVFLYKEERSQQWQLIYNKRWILGSIWLHSV